ncbi:MAG: hypothetical protein H6R26_3011 [Proteobacteria bacterium]|nr:hypothetical protein [Pseudomonadota bacterium]
MNSLRLLSAVVSLALVLTGCTTNRELSLGRPAVQSEPLPALGGTNAVDGDDYYVQLLSDFQFGGEVGDEEICRDLGSSYRKGGTTSLVMFQVRNDMLKFRREVPGLVYRSASGRCSVSLDAKKVYLSPWMRLDSGQDAQVDYRFATTSDDDLDLGKLGNDVNTASNVLALTGVGTGVALMGKLASGWMTYSAKVQPAASAPGSAALAKHHEESHSLPPAVVLSGNRATVNRMSITVREVEAGSWNPFAKPRVLGELKVYADSRPSLLLKTGANGVPDARDLSLEELWRSSIRSGAEGMSLQRYIQEADHPDRPNLQPDWNNYRDVELNCRKLKVVMRDLGFNKFDRNAVLHYFLDKTPEWKNYNLTGQKALSAATPVAQLERYRAANFGGCLVDDDYEVMKSLSLPVNASVDWTNTLQQLREKESYLSGIRALERQLVSVVRNPNPTEMERQIFPLVSSRQSGAGTVLLQDRLGNFGLERLLNVPTVPGEGLVLGSAQLAQLFAGLKIADASCARPAFEQGRPVPNVAILLMATAPESPLAKGAALEFEFDGSRIVRIALQSPTFRDFRQDIISNPQLGDCRIDPTWLERL